MTKNDRQALQLAMTQWCAEDKEFASKLKEETWEKIAKDAAWHCQIRSLNLNPWESAPCEIHDPDNLTPGHNPHAAEEDRKAAQLLKRMLAKGISKWHPDPIAALEQ
jgi:hypothetical protein